MYYSFKPSILSAHCIYSPSFIFKTTLRNKLDGEHWKELSNKSEHCSISVLGYADYSKLFKVLRGKKSFPYILGHAKAF